MWPLVFDGPHPKKIKNTQFLGQILGPGCSQPLLHTPAVCETVDGFASGFPPAQNWHSQAAKPLTVPNLERYPLQMDWWNLKEGLHPQKIWKLQKVLIHPNTSYQLYHAYVNLSIYLSLSLPLSLSLWSPCPSCTYLYNIPISGSLNMVEPPMLGG